MLTQLVALHGELRRGRPVARERYDEAVARIRIMPLASKGCCSGDIFVFFEFGLIEGLHIGFLTRNHSLFVELQPPFSSSVPYSVIFIIDLYN